MATSQPIEVALRLPALLRVQKTGNASDIRYANTAIVELSASQVVAQNKKFEIKARLLHAQTGQISRELTVLVCSYYFFHHATYPPDLLIHTSVSAPVGVSRHRTQMLPPLRKLKNLFVSHTSHP
jgi:hypothetical protein